MTIVTLSQKSHWVRQEIFKMMAPAGQGHIASSLSQVEIMVALFYGNICKYKKSEPYYADRDRVIVSKGHSAAGLYPILSDIGYFDSSELKKFGNPEGILRIYGDKSIPGIECTSGSLSQAPSIGCGFSYSFKNRNEDRRSYVILSDGEHYEGQLWECAMFASHYKLDNLIFIVDRNRQIILGDTESCLKIDPLDKKYESFGWDTYEVDGHNPDELVNVLNECKNNKNNKPKLVVANTIKGKGVSYMENITRWHNTFPNEQEIEKAFFDLDIKNS
jgi:transketolase